MESINPITGAIIEKTKEGDTVRAVAIKTGFAYSAVYNWINKLENMGVFKLEKRGNKTIIKINSNEIYASFQKLIEKIKEQEKDYLFWDLMKKTKLKIRFGKETSSVIYTQGSYITGDFYNKIYYIDVLKKDYPALCKILEKYNINFSREKSISKSERPFIIINIKVKIKKIYNLKNLPLTTLEEVVKWCKKLKLEPILEQLNILYKIPIKQKYSEIYTNV